jgi:hypothetical protein
MTKPLPPPLPPGERTVGQLVAESMRLYGQRFWPCLTLGLSVAVLFQFLGSRPGFVWVLVLWLGAPFLTLSYIGAVVIASGERLTGRSWLVALVTGTLALMPAAVLFRIYVLPGLAWLALVGLAVPVAIIERRGFRASFSRATRLARADYVHALGSLATLTIVFALTAGVLGLLLQGQAGTAERIAAFLADLVISPVLFLGAALLYFDQAARVVDSVPSDKRRRDAGLHPAVDAHGSGRPDAEVEP